MAATDGRAFENIFQDHQELYGDDYRSRTIIPGLLEYFRDPSAANACALLRSLRIPLPYAQLNSVLSAFNGRPPPGSSAPSGPSARSGGANGTAGTADFFEIHKRIDFLHDVLGERIYPEVAERILRGAPMTPAVNARVHDAIRKNNAAFRARERGNPANPMLTAVAEELAGISRALFQLPSATADGGSGMFAPTMLTDAYLTTLVQEWVSRPVLEIVLDGLLATNIPTTSERARRPASELSSVNDSKIARSMCACAFLQLMFCDWKLSRALPPAVRRVAFLTGDFQTLDNPGADAFIERWIRRVHSDSEALSHLSADQIFARRVRPKDLPTLSATPFRDVALGRNGLTVAAGVARTFVPYRAPALAAPATQRTAFYTSYKKEWLSDVLAEYLSASPESRESAKVTAFIDTLITVNAFRDAVKAEVAIARGAVFITVDALALVYHQARAGAGAARAVVGGGLMLFPLGFENLRLKYYTPKRSGPATRQSRAVPRGT
jgi:hypothetical protein